MKQATEEERFAVEDEEDVFDGPVIKKHQLNDSTCKDIISQLERNENDPEYTIRPALGVVFLHHRKPVVAPESLLNNLVELYRIYATLVLRSSSDSWHFGGLEWKPM